MAGNEQSPGLFPLIAPTDLDYVVQNMIAELKGMYNWDLINAELWGLIGINGAPIYDFLDQYLQVARAIRVPYTASELWPKYKSEFATRFRLSEDELNKKIEVYLRVFRTLYTKKMIPDSILKPWEYQPQKSGLAANVGSVATQLLAPLFPYALGAVAVYAGMQILGKKVIP